MTERAGLIERLRSLSIDHGIHSDVRSRDTSIALEEVAAALTTHTAVLERVKEALERIRDFPYSDVPEKHAIAAIASSGLEALSALKELETTASSLPSEATTGDQRQATKGE